MGDYQHRAILVSGEEDAIDEAHEAAVAALGERSSRVTPWVHGANGWCFFAVLPSGGKLGGSVDNEVRDALDEWKTEMRTARVQWVDVAWGELGTLIIEEKP